MGAESDEPDHGPVLYEPDEEDVIDPSKFTYSSGECLRFQ